MMAAFSEADGLFLEPAGENKDERTETARKQQVEAMRCLVKSLVDKRPELELVLAIGSNSPKSYRDEMAKIDRDRIYWWWCWGTPIEDHAMDEYPSVLGWHAFWRRPPVKHGSNEPPKAHEAGLTGFATTYSSGIGFGNVWSGTGPNDKKHAGVKEVHPHTIPFFSHQYWFRERCWDIHIEKDQFAARMARRLFDADMPKESIQYYLTVADWCPLTRVGKAKLPSAMKAIDRDTLATIDAFVTQHLGKGTLRNCDTLKRMREAVDELKKRVP